ncbi:MAG: oligosaccharide flippase family protein [Bacteroidales bacterium]|nr:oligosaccharide flippase family protein [Bacteroidales bacterium]
MIPNSKTIAKNVGIFGGAQVFSVLAALIRTKFAAVFIGTAGVGLSAVYNTVVTFYSNVAGLGLSFSGVKHLSEVYAQGDKDSFCEEVARLRTLGLLGAIGGFFLSLVFAPVLSYFYFEDWSQTLPFALLSFFIAVNIFAGVELAVLKSMQKTRSLAMSAIWLAVVSVVFSVPFYVFCGVRGVIWAVMISGISGALITIWLGHRAIGLGIASPLVNMHKQSIAELLRHSRPVIVLGIAFLLGGVVASGSEMIIQGYLSATSSLSVLGLYKAGYQLSITYTGMIFTAVSNDFYPRLSAVNSNINERNILISRQIMVLLFFTVPLVALFVLLVPYILPILFDDTFNPVSRMVQIASLSIIVKSVTMPLNFLPLSLGKSLDYLCLEGVFWLLLVPLVILGFAYWGLDGTGMAILLCHLIELLYVILFCRIRYGYRFVTQ